MLPEKIPTRTRLALAQKMRFLRFTRGWSQEVLAELAGSRSRLPGSRDISASVHVMHRTYISQIERGQVSAAPVPPCTRGPLSVVLTSATLGLPARHISPSLDVMSA